MQNSQWSNKRRVVRPFHLFVARKEYVGQDGIGIIFSSPEFTTTFVLSPREWKKFISCLQRVRQAGKGKRLRRFLWQYDFDGGKASFDSPEMDSRLIGQLGRAVAPLDGKRYIKPQPPAYSAQEMRLMQKEARDRQRTGVSLLVTLVKSGVHVDIQRTLFMRLRRTCLAHAPAGK